MWGHGRVALVPLALAAAACLDSPGAAGDGQGERDATVPPDASRCPALVTSGFDGPAWQSLAPPGSFVDRAASSVRVRATPSADVYVYGDLHTVEQAPIEGSSVTAQVDGPIVSVSGRVGIAWSNLAGDDSYDLEVADGALRARRVTAAGGESEVCLSGCPDYSETEHARLRLLAENRTVRYQSASESGDWVDIGSAPATDMAYAVLLYAGATGPGSGDLTVIGAEWLACGE